MFLSPGDILKGKRVIVVGFGRQGQALARWLPTIGAIPIVTVTDGKTAEQLGINPADYPRTRFQLDATPESLVEIADMICVSGGVPLDSPLIQLAAARHIPITNDAQLFVDRCPASIIGITGSAGKTTTTTLVGEMMKKAGYTTWIGGNIGNVLLDVMVGIRPEHRVVMEFSSFQLELMFTSPPIAAILNITPNHLDRHGTMQEYMRAKANIIAHQTGNGKAILGRDDWGSRMVEGVASGDILWFSRSEIVSDGAFLAGQRLFVSGLASPTGEAQLICEVTDIPLRGEHNVSNVLAACAIAGAAGIPPEVMTETIRNFKAVAHRLETVREINGVTYVNDSIATAPERVLAALRSYDEPIVLLAGGADKKLPWQDMIALALQKTRHIIAFGRDGDIVVNTVREIAGNTECVTRVQTLDEAVALATTLAQSGDVVLLSPGGTSYDAYKDFVERGEHFRRLVNAL
ncbi:MAG TPA: UDP-N-acetylmuramoyl-L-alanine--D-glutamate ligase [Phototrophicaceae bacterium]|jgi:UDP-N-acetylmuramoylalanine--D-glutamate ligase|nr:UDP-N-acetylmuramoyl-L-alanine--D-glutamate ligase [Phototrophicaceae bacterium]